MESIFSVGMDNAEDFGLLGVYCLSVWRVLFQFMDSNGNEEYDAGEIYAVSCENGIHPETGEEEDDCCL